ncbi:DUF3488 and transglutaminase-like domain-containing protein [uncultured Paludibaculum sp.]|uniref:transglutaminase TgpA family protein n=1 Tax=uncultured Paludibaculum sp. TaxID=1765020 RepID=UPI002AAAA4F0|nr:DUF3488 and transglutaminase-like domain-containing protein [uncultured Paludibaculum sp.]
MAARRTVEFEESSIRRFFEASLLGMLLSGYCALLLGQGLTGGAVDAPSAALAGMALVARIFLVAGWWKLDVASRWITVVTLLYIAFYPIDYLYLSRDFLRATVHMVFFVAIVKVLTASRPRDYFFLKIIAFLELLAASILSTNLTFFVFLALFLLSTVATFASTEILRAREGRKLVTHGIGVFGRRLGWVTGLTTTGILFVTMALFFVLPRTARAALDRLLPGRQSVTGFASEVTLGQVGEIQRRSTVVMHVRFEDGYNPPSLKWRGGALSEFNNWKWYNAPGKGRPLRPELGLLKLVDDEHLQQTYKRVTYEVVLNGTGSDSLFVAGTPEYLRVPATMVMEMPNGGYRIPYMDPDGFRYVVHASFGWQPLNPHMGSGPRLSAEARAALERLPENERNFHLSLPPLDKRVIPLAREITARAKTDGERARAIEQYLRTQFRYSLTPLDHEVEDPLATFLFDRRQGHCEYFASAMAVMLRAVWVPSRVVTGFQSGSYNSISGWSVVRASDAHSWVEAWIPGQGWTTYDPTPSDPNLAAGGPLSRLALWSDAVEMFWQEWVLGYDLDRQLTLALRMEQSRHRLNLDWLSTAWRAMSRVSVSATGVSPRLYAGGFVVLACVAMLILTWPQLRAWRVRWMGRKRLLRGEADSHDAALIYREMLKQLKRRGVEKPPSWTPAEFARSVRSEALAEIVREFTAVYNALRFGGRADDAARLATLLERIEHLP